MYEGTICITPQLQGQRMYEYVAVLDHYDKLTTIWLIIFRNSACNIQRDGRSLQMFHGFKTSPLNSL